MAHMQEGFVYAARPVPTLAVRQPSLAIAIPTALLLVDYASRGNITPTAWPRTVAESLPAELLQRSEGLRAVLAHGAVLRAFLVGRLPDDHAAHTRWPALRRELLCLAPDEILGLVEQGVESNLDYAKTYNLPLSATARRSLRQSARAAGLEALRLRLQAVLDGWGVAEVEGAALEVCRPASFQQVLVDLLDAIWDLGFADLWHDTLPRLQSAASAAPRPPTALTGSQWVAEVSGLQPEEHYAELADEAAHLCCVPCPAMGRSLSLFDIAGTTYVAYEPREMEDVVQGRRQAVVLTDLAPLATRMEALGDRTRMAIMLHLAATAEQSMQDIADALSIHQSTVSRQVGVLLRAGLITERRGGIRRYQLNRPGVRELCKTVEEALG